MTERLQTEQIEEGGGSRCYTCLLFDRVKGCQGLSDTFFPNRECPFYKPVEAPKKEEPTGSDCSRCFASSPVGCRALVAPPRGGNCVFFKDRDKYEEECRRCDKRIRAYLKAHPEFYEKYSALRDPKRFHGGFDE